MRLFLIKLYYYFIAFVRYNFIMARHEISVILSNLWRLIIRVAFLGVPIFVIYKLILLIL